MIARSGTLTHKFVEHIPEQLEDGVLYVSISFATAAHRCACGCGREVITPITPTDWQLTFDGETISLAPSIGNWNYECQSHYWIKQNNVRWAPRWSRLDIERGRTRDRETKERYRAELTAKHAPSLDVSAPTKPGLFRSLLAKLRRSQ
jgi:Family of unknown function (DUF6527)